MIIGKGYEDKYLTEAEIRELMAQVLTQVDLSGKRVLIITPDSTRTAPLPQMFRLFYEYLGQEVAALDYLIALGTHMAMTDAALNRLFGLTPEEQAGKYAKVNIFNHRWDLPDTFVNLGHITEAEIEEITGGLMRQAVDVRLNKLVFDYDQIIICGPTFPHEVVGFSGGNKYFFPGIGGSEVINFSHWLGAVITSYEVIGTKYTPVRRVIDKAAAFIDRPKLCFSMVVKGEDLAGLYVGTPEEAYDAAADLSAKLHINWVDRPYQKVFSVMPTLYDDLWTAAKGMYKTEPAIADGGEVIIYAPHIDEISYTHGKIIDEVGYHVRDYFLKQWDKFKHYPGGVLAHSTHLRGIGEYDVARGIESPRIDVTLATRIPEERCRQVNLGYLDLDKIDLEDWKNREDEGILLIPKAGEMLYRVTPYEQ
jgi:nickel-dependent lactate racemase